LRAGGLRFVLQALTVGAIVSIAPASLQAVAADEEQQLDALRGRIERLRQRMVDTEETRVEARDRLRDTERAISQASRSLHDLARKRDAVRVELRALAARARAAESDIAMRRQMLGQQLAQRYAYGERSTLRLVLSGRDPNETARDLQYYRYLSAGQAEFIRGLRNELARTRELEQSVRAKADELAAIEAEQRSRRADLVKQQAAHRNVLVHVSNELRAQRREVHTLERDEKRLSRLVAEIEKVLADAPPGPRNDKIPEADSSYPRFGTLKGKLRLPARGEIANRFGAPRAGGGTQWKGLFIRSSVGTEVRAVASGRVVFAEWLRGFGNLLILDHGDAYLTIYGNNESLLRGVGDVVRTGDVVATAGNSGGSVDSGIYFEIRHEGRPFDPLRWVSLR
jgi:septal ring factor EnvC (AmiA/AmiB activator)